MLEQESYLKSTQYAEILLLRQKLVPSLQINKQENILISMHWHPVQQLEAYVCYLDLHFAANSCRNLNHYLSKQTSYSKWR